MHQQYNQIVEWFDQARTKDLMERAYLDQVVSLLPANAKVLDLGCGTGEPLGQFFVEQGYALTGVDAAPNMIALCQQRLPQARFVCQDMRGLDLNETFDLVWAWDSFFHLPHDDQRAMFTVFQRHTRLGGVLVFTSGPEHGEIWSEMNGLRFYHASLSTQEYQSLLTAHGFETLTHRVEDPECGEHTVWVAQSAR